MPLVDGREDWEIAVAIRLQNAAWYLSLLEFDDRKRIRYETMFQTTEGLEQWTKTQARKQIEAINEIVELHPLGCDAPSVATPCAASLLAMGLSGRVRIAPMSRTEGG